MGKLLHYILDSYKWFCPRIAFFKECAKLGFVIALDLSHSVTALARGGLK